MLAAMFRATILAALVSAPVLAQTPCYAGNEGNNYWDVSLMGAPGLLGFQIAIPSGFSVSRIEIFTGEATGTNSVSLWTHDAVNNRPGSQISPAGTWSMSNVNSWQGADLGSPAAVSTGGIYWVVWGFVTQSQSSVDLPTAVLGERFYISLDSGVSWIGPYQDTGHHWKFRLYGNCAGTGVTSFCLGDGTQATACPCANNGTSGHGCENSASAGGAQLTSTGTTSPDTLVLTSASEPASVLSILHQGDASVAGTPFGDGVLCLGGNVLKLYVDHAAGGVSIAPGAGDPSISQRSATLGDTIPSGATRYYQVVYRDKTPSFCPTGGTFNVSNGLTVVW